MMMMIVVELEEVGVFGLRLLRLDSSVMLSRTDLLFCVINALTERKSWIPTQVHNCDFFRLEFLFFWSYFGLEFCGESKCGTRNLLAVETK